MEAPARKTTAIDAGTFRTALAVFLDLPIAGFAGVRCPCGEMLTPETGAAHVSRCKHHGSTGRHNTFGLSWDDVLQSVPGAPKVWVRGRAALLLRTWRFGLAVGLMHGRVGQIEAALRKLDEQERRAGAGADKQLKAKKVHAIGREFSALVDCAGIIRAGPSRAR